MPTLKRQKSDGTWEFLQLVGQEYTELFDGATSNATPNTLIKRDADGRARVAAPDNDADIATKNYVDSKTAIVGVEWNQANDVLYRYNVFTRAQFDTISPWQDMRRCMVEDDGSINYYIDPDDPTKIGEVINTGTYTTGAASDHTGTHGQVMVYVPKFYYKSSKVGNVYTWEISNTLLDGFAIHPVFVSNTVEKDYFLFSAFEGNVSSNVMRSISGVQPSTSTNVTGAIANFRTYAQARNPDPTPEGWVATSGWQQQLFNQTCAIQLLYLVEYANFDSQSTIGKGVVDIASGTVNHSINTGGTISLGNTSGMASGTDGVVSISYRGIENFWGNIWKWVDGLNIKADYNPWIADYGYVSDTFTTPYVNTGLTLPSTSDSYISNILFNGLDYSFLPSAVGGSSSTYLKDNYWVTTSNRVARFGGRWHHGVRAGAFCWNLDNASGGSSRSLGGRLLFVP